MAGGGDSNCNLGCLLGSSTFIFFSMPVTEQYNGVKIYAACFEINAKRYVLSVLLKINERWLFMEILSVNIKYILPNLK